MGARQCALCISDERDFESISDSWFSKHCPSKLRDSVKEFWFNKKRCFNQSFNITQKQELFTLSRTLVLDPTRRAKIHDLYSLWGINEQTGTLTHKVYDNDYYHVYKP